MSDPEETTLRLERLIPSPPEMLFDLWVRPAELVKWWAPDGYEALVDTLDVRPGGRWRTMLRRPDGATIATSGVYHIVEPPRRLAFTWAWEDASGMRGHETKVSVRFEPAPGGTRIVLVQQSFETRLARDNHDRGWSASCDRMARMVGA
ncbi:SRPBCC domain-containing protein [Bradyrhizobium sp. S69]|uniref:SRPBCC family protein n=1 Tax=Bradyrhizobium sp. S69 TaxID=1641856 RepID=UPI00131AE7D2|nr:SRPBCC domain-containing protein [Bradyrhizobium sp. S69]